jgi:hypothetical protein
MTQQHKRRGPNKLPLTHAQAVAAELLEDAREAAKVKIPMRFGSSIPVVLIRRENDEKGLDAAIKIGHECFIEGTITDAQIVAIALGKATLRGFSNTGITYHDELCATCRGKGKVTRASSNPAMRGFETPPCPTCEGDGFAPPMAEMAHRQQGAKP